MDEAAAKHPDFVITAAGEDVTQYCVRWDIADKEEGMGHLDVTLDNTDMRFDGKFKLGEMLCIRFGQWGNLSAKVEMSIGKRKPHFGLHGLTLTIVGLDATSKLGGKTGRGQQSGTKVKPALDQIAKATGTEIDTSKIKDQGDDGGTADCKRGPCLNNIQMDELIQQHLNGATADKGQDNSGEQTFQGAGEGGAAGSLAANRATGSGINPADDSEKNRMNKASDRARSPGINARMHLVGYPLLKAKSCVTIQNVGEWSGKWYVQNCGHSWERGHGYQSSAQLMRGSLGGQDGGGACAPQPMLFHANIWDGSNKIYAGPRQSDADSQATFTWGDGTYLVSFEPEQDAMTGKGAGNEASGKTINPNKASDPNEEVKSDKSQGSSTPSEPEGPTIGTAGVAQ